MNLPYNLELIPGVRTDHKGRAYQIGRYPSGKQAIVYVEQDDKAPPARTIPVASEPVRKERKLMTTGLNGERKPVVHIPRRLMTIDYRMKGEKALRKAVGPNADCELLVKDLRTHAWTYPNEVGQEEFCRERDTGSVIPCINGLVDWMTQYHIDEEVK